MDKFLVRHLIDALKYFVKRSSVISEMDITEAQKLIDRAEKAYGEAI